MSESLDTVDNALPCTADSSSMVNPIQLRVRERLFQNVEIEVVEELPATEYLRIEFPSECWNFPNFTSTVDHILQRFVKMLPRDPRIEHVYWEPEDDVLKICTIIPEPDFELEAPIYDAQLAFMDAFPTYECDFSVIYRFGKPLDEIEPQGARRIF